ncbi:hypothetical protein LR48_Vigan04g083200 [Vigna angularis]|uniref:Uncharacterized protein n=1 Tax=Phaseolus angularis TaxID=3914 RepID=A0A0L9UDM7_PHAAN|nr:hypothetical protein LR48_Vigan04g083200 [Vigna angularis]
MNVGMLSWRFIMMFRDYSSSRRGGKRKWHRLHSFIDTGSVTGAYRDEFLKIVNGKRLPTASGECEAASGECEAASAKRRATTSGDDKRRAASAKRLPTASDSTTGTRSGSGSGSGSATACSSLERRCSRGVVERRCLRVCTWWPAVWLNGAACGADDGVWWRGEIGGREAKMRARARDMSESVRYERESERFCGKRGFA